MGEDAGVAQQNRFDRNMKWLNALASGNAAQRAAVQEEIRRANLSKAERDEFEAQRKYYRIR